MKNYIIALDGPGGSGKTTLAQILADRLGIEYLNTGAMYRAITKYFLDHDIKEGDSLDLNQVFAQVKIDLAGGRVFLNGEDVSEVIREDEVTKNVSRVSAIREVREFLVSQQREIAKDRSFILDGRDIGTVVFPNAKYKFFLTASPEVRARRRFDQNESSLSLEEIQRDIERRDRYDSTREVSPLKRADDAILIDTSDLSIEETVEKILSYIGEEDVL